MQLKGFKLDFGQDLTAAYKITYKTTSVNRVETSDDIHNTVTSTTYSATDSQHIDQVIIKKDNFNINYEDKTVEWKIVINKDP